MKLSPGPSLSLSLNKILQVFAFPYKVRIAIWEGKGCNGRGGQAFPVFVSWSWRVAKRCEVTGSRSRTGRKMGVRDLLLRLQHFPSFQYFFTYCQSFLYIASNLLIPYSLNLLFFLFPLLPLRSSSSFPVTFYNKKRWRIRMMQLKRYKIEYVERIINKKKKENWRIRMICKEREESIEDNKQEKE